MSSNSRFTVAVHILALLALEETPLSSKAIANSVNTNPVVIRRILGVLSKDGLVATQLGVDGGSGLACAPQQITLLAVYRATEQGNVFAFHNSQPSTHCQCGRNIQPVLARIFKEAEIALEMVLAETTIADVVQNIKAQPAA